MDSLELSKVVGAGCVALLAYVGLSEISHGLVAVEQVETPSFAMEIETAEADAEEEAGPSLAMLLAEADLDAGKKVFNKCTACHVADEPGVNKVGPNLHAVMGRQVAGLDSFDAYSGNLPAAEVWGWENMDAFLENPKGWAPGTSMGFSGLRKPADRANVIAWLNAQNPTPIEYPAE